MLHYVKYLMFESLQDMVIAVVWALQVYMVVLCVMIALTPSMIIICKKLCMGDIVYFCQKIILWENDTDHWYGKTEQDCAPTWPSRDCWLDQWEEVENNDIPLKISGMKWPTIFHELPYWKVSFFVFCNNKFYIVSFYFWIVCFLLFKVWIIACCI